MKLGGAIPQLREWRTEVFRDWQICTWHAPKFCFKCRTLLDSIMPYVELLNRSKTFYCMLFKGPGPLNFFINQQKCKGIEGPWIDTTHTPLPCHFIPLKVHKREKFFGSDFEFFTIL